MTMQMELGATFQLGQTMIEEGVFFRVENLGPPQIVNVPNGIIAVIARASRGALNTPIQLTDPFAIDAVAGKGTWTDLLREAFAGAADAGAGGTVIWIRPGTGGTVANFAINLTGGSVVGLNVPMAWPGVDGNAFGYTLQDSLFDSTRRLFTLYEGTTQRLQVSFAKAPTTTGGHGEAGALVTALNASGSPYIGTATLNGTPADNSTLATVSAVTTPGTAGADPTVTGTEYSAAMTALRNVWFNTLAIDAQDTATFALVQTEVDHQASLGKRFVAVIGEDATSINRSTRETNAKAFNDFRIVYVGNGFTNLSGARSGSKGAARAAGKIAGTELNDSITHQVVTGALTIDDPFNLDDYRVAVQSGMLVYRYNPTGQVWTGENLNTYLTADATHHKGWEHIHVVRIYDAFRDQVGATLAPLVGHLRNTAKGRRVVIDLVQRIINQFVAQELFDGTIANTNFIQEDPLNLPQGNQAWFVVSAQVADMIDQLYISLNFPFSS